MSPRLVYRPLRWRPSDVDYLTAGDTVTLCDTIPRLDGVQGDRGDRYAWVRNEAGATSHANLDEIVWVCDHELLAALSTMVTREVDARCRDCGARDVLEVVRLVTDGEANACSLLYSAAARAGLAMGYKRIQTYILDSETGTSLVASGWTFEGEAGGGQWKHTDGKPRRTDQPTGMKTRWAKVLSVRPDLIAIPQRVRNEDAETLFGDAS